MKKMLPAIFLFSCLIWIVGCVESDCSLNSNPMNLISFMNSQTGKAFILNDTLTVTALDTDSTLINKESKTSKLTLPLNYEGEKTSYIFKYTIVELDTVKRTGLKDTVYVKLHTKRDTISMTYITEKKFKSMDCGILIYFDLKSVHATNNLIDSVRIINPAVNEIEKTNIEIFFRTVN